MNIKLIFNKQLNNISRLIYNLPIDSRKKMLTDMYYRQFLWRLRFRGEEYKEVSKNFTFCCSNYLYGHEYCLKHYSGYKDYIYGLIEHGIFFGHNTSKIGEQAEWDLGSILTFGEDRVKLLKELYPDYNIVGIGPRVHYAETDKEYYDELKRRLDNKSRTIALYPTHGMLGERSLYNMRKFVEKAMTVANEINAKNILVSLHPSDLANGLDKEFLAENKNVIIVSGSKDQIRFLPRLRAIMSLADLIYTNDIGTHVGYSVYLKKTNIIDCSTNENGYKGVYLEELKEFAKVFNGANPLELTSEQKELCNYYYGYNYIKTPEEMYRELEKCKREFKKRFR